MENKEKPEIEIILIESEYDSPETLKQIVDQHKDLSEVVKIDKFNGPAKGVDESLWMALLARYGNDKEIDVLSRPYNFSEGKVGSVYYAIAKIYESKDATNVNIKKDNKAHINESEYEGVKYRIFDNLLGFLEEVEKSKKGVLKTNFNNLSNQIEALMEHISKVFGANSREARAVAESLLFCGKCGVAFSNMFKGSLLMGSAYKNMDVSCQCPKCGSEDIVLLYRL